MVSELRLTPQTLAVLEALLSDITTPRWGRDIAKATNLKSGSLHPILARLEEVGWVTSRWEDPAEHEGKGRPRRRYYQIDPDQAMTVRRALSRARATSSGPALSWLQPQPDC